MYNTEAVYEIEKKREAKKAKFVLFADTPRKYTNQIDTFLPLLCVYLSIGISCFLHDNAG